MSCKGWPLTNRPMSIYLSGGTYEYSKKPNAIDGNQHKAMSEGLRQEPN